MAKVMVEIDTEMGDFKVTVNGNEFPNPTSLMAYKCFEEGKMCVDVEVMSIVEDEEDVKTYTRLSAKEKKSEGFVPTEDKFGMKAAVKVEKPEEKVPPVEKFFAKLRK